MRAERADRGDRAVRVQARDEETDPRLQVQSDIETRRQKEAAERGRLARDVGVQAFEGRHPCGGSGPDSGRRATTISNPSRRGHRLKTEMRRPEAQREVKKTLKS